MSDHFTASSVNRVSPKAVIDYSHIATAIIVGEDNGYQLPLSQYVFLGTNKNDEMILEAHHNTLFLGIGGNDFIQSNNGHDVAILDTGNDTAYAGGGDDYVNAGQGNDTIYAGTGNDTVLASFGDDLIVAGDGNNTIEPGWGNDTIVGGLGADTIIMRSYEGGEREEDGTRIKDGTKSVKNFNPKQGDRIEFSVTDSTAEKLQSVNADFASVLQALKAMDLPAKLDIQLDANVSPADVGVSLEGNKLIIAGATTGKEPPTR